MAARERPGPGEWLGWGGIVLLGALCAGLGWWLGERLLWPPEQPPPPGLQVVAEGERVPADLVLPALRGEGRLALGGPGRPRLVNYWASWCGPCREEMPVLDAYAAEQGEDGVQVIGVALDSPGEAEAFLRQVPVRFALALEAPGPRDSSVRLGNGRGILPYTVLIGADGRLLKRHYGAFPDVAAVRAFATPE